MNTTLSVQDLKNHIREIADFPKPGILFYDITTLLQNSAALHCTIENLVNHYRDQAIDYIVGVEARGFIFGAVVAYLLGVGFIPIRKPKKLPGEKISVTYHLEYGASSLEIHKDAIAPGKRIVVIDDLLATGGTSAAVASILERMAAEIVGFGFVVELEFLQGRKKLVGHDVFSLIQY